MAPQRLALTPNTQHGKRTILLLRRLYRTAVEHKRVALIDFSDLVEASAPSLTVVAAEIHRCLEIAPNSLQGIAPRDPSMLVALDQFGVLASLGLESPKVSESTTILRMRTGLAEEIRRTEFLDRFLAPVFPGQSPLKGRVKGAITEALLNIVDHAYPTDVVRTHVCPSTRWWITGLRSVAGDQLWFCVYDLGVGLPATLPRSRSSAIREAIAQMAGEDLNSDHKMIKLAVQTSLTQTGAQGRGRGLREMARLIDRFGKGTLWILSRDGTYIYQRGSQVRDDGSRISETFMGTLIVWTLSLTEAAASEPEV